MTTALLMILLSLALAAIVLLVVVLIRLSAASSPSAEITRLGARAENLEGSLTRVEGALRDGLTADRESRAAESRATREEIRTAITAQTESA